MERYNPVVLGVGAGIPVDPGMPLPYRACQVLSQYYGLRSSLSIHATPS